MNSDFDGVDKLALAVIIPARTQDFGTGATAYGTEISEFVAESGCVKNK